ncbi:MAG: hypothetical protein F6K14_26020 [Symploca sp. SIO2C1]|nr:hypothetical protein [Symploca sp. SIO2C1]
MNKYVISLGIVLLSGTNAIAADCSTVSIERDDLEVYSLINSSTAQVILNQAVQGFGTVNHTDSIPMTVADKFADPERGSPDSRPDDQSK